MKLFLSSIRLPDSNEKTQLFGDKAALSVAIIPNAWDVYPEDRQKTELANTVAQFKEQGYETTVIDLTTANEKVKSDLSPYDFVWVMGGNTFYLNYKLRMTGFDQVLKNAVSNGVVYGGTSAGAVVATPTLHGAEHVDDVSKAPEVVWDGLKLVDFGIVPHWGNAKYRAELEQMESTLRPHVASVIKLTDDEAKVIIDGEVILK